MTVKQRSSQKSPGIVKQPSKTDTCSHSSSERESPHPGPRIEWRRIITRLLMMVPFAAQKEEISKRSVEISCSKDYADELRHFQGCIPKKCGRVIFDTLVTTSEVAALLNIAERGLSVGGSTGGASILDLHSGALSHGNAFVNIFKLEEAKNLFNAQDFKIYRLKIMKSLKKLGSKIKGAAPVVVTKAESVRLNFGELGTCGHVKNKIHHAIANHFGISRSGLYLTHPTFFSRITPVPPQTIHDEYWHPHVDKETYESFHYTSLLYLSDFGHHFDGGRFIFIDKDSNKTVEPRRGRVSAFTSGSENLHCVERVTGGTRYAITVSFTCDPNHAIDDPTVNR
ncbi:2-oxoglutarate and iron-dependent oxygenase domain-containing protein 3-like [Homarus americanus]|uniref:2-oxoglutarate and iron-dependent oxygenase domain-containing protein 3-like n=1 Tax=Homarus americanus TaxID=6706 RepID=A0A8J5JJB9_HOMAM|nr:2-oxoglutarate and iron-dependent oxygenase domain-containing protein 3-like [Homarus americanus]